MRYVTLFLGILSIALVTVIHFYPEEVSDFIDTYINKKEYVVATPNDYYLDANYEYIHLFLFVM